MLTETAYLRSLALLGKFREGHSDGVALPG